MPGRAFGIPNLVGHPGELAQDIRFTISQKVVRPRIVLPT